MSKFSTKHDGICHRKTTYSSAGAEEYEGARAGQNLLLNKDGTPRDASTCVFIDKLCADNDTSGPNNFIAKQHEILGSAVDNMAEHIPDGNHRAKGNSNEFYSVCKKDPSFKGKNGLCPNRIRSITADVNKAVKHYAPHVGNAEKRDECLLQLRAIIHHHCNNHSCCKLEKFCTNLKVRNEHPEWNEDQVLEETLNRSKRHKSYMDLTDEGIELLEKIILKRYNEKTIDKIAQLGSSNKCENFWSQLVKLSEGKRITGCGTDLWYSMLQLCYCMNGRGRVEKTRKELSDVLNLAFTSIEERACELSLSIRDKNKKRLGGEVGKKNRLKRKLVAGNRANKDPKSKRHKSNKVPLEKSCKKTTAICSKCGHPGHSTRNCIVLHDPKKKRTKQRSFRWDKIRSTSEYVPRAEARRSKQFDWSKSSLAR